MAVVMNGVDPNDLRFTQHVISPAFKHPFQGVFLEDAIDKIKRKDMTVSTFPMPVVIQHENTLWCLNNRRLFVFRKAEVEKIDVQISRLSMHPRLSLVLKNPEDKKKMMKKKYFPYVIKYRPGRGVHSNHPPKGFPALPRHAGYCSPTRSIHHTGPNFHAVVGQPGQQHPCRFPMQNLHNYFVLNSMQVALIHAHYCGPEARCILPNATNYIQLQGSAATISTPVTKVQEGHGVQIDSTKNPEVGVCAPPSPIFISPRPSTPKCSPSQVSSGPIVCVYNKEERLASPMTRAFTKPNAGRDPKPVCSGQNLKGKLAVVEEMSSSQLPSKIPSAAGPTMSSERPPSASRMDPRLATGLWKPKPDSMSQGMGNPVAPPKQPKQVPSAKLHASVELPGHHLINQDTIPNESCKFPAAAAAAAAGPTMTSGRPQLGTRMEPRLGTGERKPKPDSISQGMGNPEAPPKQPKQVPRVTDVSMDVLDWQPINLETFPHEELPDKRMNARILPIDDKPVEISGISITPADHRNERVVDMPPSPESEPLLRHVPVTNIARIWSLLHVPVRYISGCWGFVFNLAKKLGRRRRLPSASASASAASNV